MIRIAAVADLHCRKEDKGRYGQFYETVHESADILAVAGDLTATGMIREMEIFIREFSGVKIPMVCVLGNHEYQSDNQDRFKEMLKEAGIIVLDGNTAEIACNGETVGFAGCKGMFGGFDDTALPNFGERIMKNLFTVIKGESRKIELGLKRLTSGHKVVIMHYSPIRDTLKGESVELYAYLGSSLPSMWIDAMGADLVLHGHAHKGIEKGETAGGTPVRNVSLPVIENHFIVYELS